MGSKPKMPPPPPPPPPPPSAGKTTAESGSSSRRTRQKQLALKGTSSTLIAGENASSTISRSGNSLLG